LWSEEEDDILRRLVSERGQRRWTEIASRMHEIIGRFDRNGKQCRERWFNHLNSDLKSKDWSEEELELFLQLYRQHHNHWSEIAKQMPGRCRFY
jgi:hypothetical protein